MFLTLTIIHILTFNLNTSKIYLKTFCPFVDIVRFWIFKFYKIV